MFHGDRVEGLQVIGGECCGDVVSFQRPNGESGSGKGKGVTAQSATGIGDGGDPCLEKTSRVMARHFESRGNFEPFRGKQHPLRKISKLVVRFCPQRDLSHDGTHRVASEWPSLRSAETTGEDVVVRMGIVDASKERERFACEESIELTGLSTDPFCQGDTNWHSYCASANGFATVVLALE
jgi:hypothetical protein